MSAHDEKPMKKGWIYKMKANTKHRGNEVAALDYVKTKQYKMGGALPVTSFMVAVLGVVDL